MPEYLRYQYQNNWLHINNSNILRVDERGGTYGKDEDANERIYRWDI